jgi:glycosyltransferase involved in cell wall biosynthesis
MRPPGAPGKKVLFCSHAAERTGPPIIMLHLARWLRANTDVDFELLFLRGGELEDEFRALAPVWILDEWEPPRAAAVAESFAWKVGLGRFAPGIRTFALRRRLRGVQDVDVVYVNTAGSVRALRYLDVGEPTLITHVHELSVGLDFHLAPEDHELIRQRTAHYIVVSEAVRDAVATSFGVPRDAIGLRYGFVESADTRPDPVRTAANRRAAGIPEDALVVGAAGLTHWRKAPDLFVQVARLVRARWTGSRPVHFLWVGGESDGPELAPVLYDRAHADLDDVVHFVGHQADPQPWFAAFDLLVLPAREDAFPLVCLEAAAEQVPLVCFDNGGMPEFVGDGECGRVVAYPDVSAMADAVLELLGDDGLRASLGRAAAERSVRGHDVEVGARGIYDELAPWL